MNTTRNKTSFVPENGNPGSVRTKLICIYLHLFHYYDEQLNLFNVYDEWNREFYSNDYFSFYQLDRD